MRNVRHVYTFYMFTRYDWEADRRRWDWLTFQHRIRSLAYLVTGLRNNINSHLLKKTMHINGGNIQLKMTFMGAKFTF